MELKGRNRLLAATALVLATALVGARDRLGGAFPARGMKSFAGERHGPVSFDAHLDRTAVLRGGDGVVRTELVIGATDWQGPHPERVPTDVVVILDRSGSMAGEKMAYAKAAVAGLIEQLGPDDRFALITYSNDAILTVAPAPAMGTAPSRWMQTIAAVAPIGGTNIARGLDLALGTVEGIRAIGRVPRVILLSDGLANQGDTSHEGLVGRARRAARGEFMLSAVGVGADFNEYLMTALADAGTGNYYYLESIHGLGDVFAREFEGARNTVATGLAVTIEPEDGIQVLDAAGYPLEHTAGAVTFRLGSLFADQERRIWVTLSVPSDTVGDYGLGRFSLTYAHAGHATTLRLQEMPHVACVAEQDQFFAGVDGEVWARSVLVDGYNKLQEDVARAVKEGRRDTADRLIQTFRRETRTMNDVVQAAPVEAHLHALGELEADVGEAFSGANQPEKRNRFSKSRGFQALENRRVGSKR